MPTKFFSTLKIIILAVLLSGVVAFAAGNWTNPTVSPTGGNIEPPINTSTTTQLKNGILGVNGFIDGAPTFNLSSIPNWKALLSGSIGIDLTQFSGSSGRNAIVVNGNTVYNQGSNAFVAFLTNQKSFQFWNSAGTDKVDIYAKDGYVSGLTVGNSNNDPVCADKVTGKLILCGVPTCQDTTANNYGGPLPCTYTMNYVLTVALTGSGTVTSNPSGISCGTDCSEGYTGATSVTLTAVPATDYEFVSWSNVAGCSTNPACTFSMTQNRTVQATFRHKLVVTITYNYFTSQNGCDPTTYYYNSVQTYGVGTVTYTKTDQWIHALPVAYDTQFTVNGSAASFSIQEVGWDTHTTGTPTQNSKEIITVTATDSLGRTAQDTITHVGHPAPATGSNGGVCTV